MANKEQPTEGEQKELSINASLDEALIGLPKEKQGRYVQSLRSSKK